MKFFSYDGPFSRAMNRVFDMVLLHLLWLVTSLPLFTIGASTTALFTVTLKIARHEEPYIWKTYWKAFRENFGQATKLWLIAAAALAADLFLLRVCMKGTNPLLKASGIFDAALLVFLILGTIYVFPIQASFENSLSNQLKNALILSLRYLPASVMLAACILVPVLLTGFADGLFPFMIAFWIAVGSSLIALAQSMILKKVFAQCVQGVVPQN